MASMVNLSPSRGQIAIATVIAAASIAFYGKAFVNRASCYALSLALPGTVTFPFSSNYTAFVESYLVAQQSEIFPACVVSPGSASEVSTAVSVLSAINSFTRQVKFAIRGGGANTNMGSSSLKDGIIINLQALSQIEVTRDRQVASLGAGLKWGPVYRELEKMGLTVAGGRVSTIGVAGVALGGGMSFLSPKHGFTCDNVINFEVVLANGSIVNANATSNPDLWKALRGGSNNFGIVTRFDMRALPQGELWGGGFVTEISTLPESLRAFHEMTTDPNYDENASLILAFGFNWGSWFVMNQVHYAKPVENPPFAHPLTGIEPKLFSNLMVGNLSAHTDIMASYSPIAQRRIYITTTTKSDLELFSRFLEIVKARTQGLERVKDAVISLTMQPMPPIMFKASEATGGNSLGIKSQDAPVVNVLFTAAWGNASDDDAFFRAGREVIEDIEKLAKSQGKSHRYKYMNYAAGSQDPITGYGPEIKAFLQDTSKKYDPKGLFQKAVPGGFKLFREV
ncbi:putative oxidoreductase [Lineolata rhizophorae]|uniref:Putative oxidoreductase n=1 Tax=Lineolata rhizophorae TaxID=578093 RepID=A0A6A6PAI5_9PEZI|nr:putative oxidoreductase [Lineolata rhizophorae]